MNIKYKKRKTKYGYVDPSFVGPLDENTVAINPETETYDKVIAPTGNKIDTTVVNYDSPIVPSVPKPNTNTDTVVDPALPTPDTSTENTDEPKELTGSEKYYQMQKDYIEQYLGRDAFEYDVNADEIYQIYRDQALKNADRARRDTVAQAAGLTGGYGSTYAARVGSEAYNDIVSGVDEMIPELYEAALNRYNAEGQEMLDKADMAGNYAAYLYAEENPMLRTIEDDDTSWNMEQRMKTLKGIYDYKGENDTGATIYDEVMRIFGNKKTGTNTGVKDKYVGEKKDWTEDQIRAELMTWELPDGSHLTRDEVEYLVNEVSAVRTVDALSNMVDADGKYLYSYIEEMEAANYTAEQIYERLEQFTDKSGAKLTEQQILAIISSM